MKQVVILNEIIKYRKYIAFSEPIYSINLANARTAIVHVKENSQSSNTCISQIR